jgi:capsular polysaccharide biosynthesis protein
VAWSGYLSVLRRRWLLIAVILALDVLASGYLYLRSARSVGYQSCLTLYVADVSSPSLIAAPLTALQSTGVLLSGETAANFFADDVLDVARSGIVATFISGRLSGRHLPSSSFADLNGSVSGSRLDRTVNLCVANPASSTALAAAGVLGQAMTVNRARFVGRAMARRTYVAVITAPTVGRASASHQTLNLVLRLVLGGIVALGLALLWDALDPTVRERSEVEAALGVPVLARFGRG